MFTERIELHVPAEFYSTMADVENLSRMINHKINDDLGAKLTEILGTEKEVIASLGKIYSTFFEYTSTIRFMQDLSWRPLIRCKNCKYQGSLNSEGRPTCRHALGLVVADDESFCSYGDKKED